MKLYLKRILLAVVAAAAALGAMAVPTAREAFIAAPADVFMLLEKNARLDMVDYFESNMTNSVDNALQGKSRITAMSPESMTIEMTPSSVYQLSVLPDGRDGIIALIVTMSVPARDSRVQFYNAADWTPLNAKSILPEASLADWLTPQGRSNRDLVESLVPFVMARYSYDAPSATLTATNELPQFLSPDVYSMIADYMRPQLVYKWNGSKFVLQK